VKATENSVSKWFYFNFKSKNCYIWNNNEKKNYWDWTSRYPFVVLSWLCVYSFSYSVLLKVQESF